MDWFLYDIGPRRERVKNKKIKLAPLIHHAFES